MPRSLNEAWVSSIIITVFFLLWFSFDLILLHIISHLIWILLPIQFETRPSNECNSGLPGPLLRLYAFSLHWGSPPVRRIVAPSSFALKKPWQHGAPSLHDLQYWILVSWQLLPWKSSGILLNACKILLGVPTFVSTSLKRSGHPKCTLQVIANRNTIPSNTENIDLAAYKCKLSSTSVTRLNSMWWALKWSSAISAENVSACFNQEVVPQPFQNTAVLWTLVVHQQMAGVKPLQPSTAETRQPNGPHNPDFAKSYAKDGSSSQFGHRKVGDRKLKAGGPRGQQVLRRFLCRKFPAWKFRKSMHGPEGKRCQAVLDHAFHLGLARNNKCAPQLRIQTAFDSLLPLLQIRTSSCRKVKASASVKHCAWKTWCSLSPTTFVAPLGRGWVKWGFTFLATGWRWTA